MYMLTQMFLPHIMHVIIIIIIIITVITQTQTAVANLEFHKKVDCVPQSTLGQLATHNRSESLLTISRHLASKS